jgi:hypothetical protein
MRVVSDGVALNGAGHSIHDEREHRPEYLECLAAFLEQHAPAAASAPR